MQYTRAVMACVLAWSAAHAAVAQTTQVEVTVGDPRIQLPGTYTYDWGWQGPAYLVNPQGSFTFEGSDLWMDAMNIVPISAAVLHPGDGLTDEQDQFQFQTALQSFGGVINDRDHSLSFNRFSTASGMSLFAPALLSNGKPNAASSGGSLQLRHLTIDMTTREVRADVLGGNGVGALSQVPIWRYDTVMGDSVVRLQYAYRDHVSAHVTLDGLTLTQTGLDVFSNALGLKPFGRMTLASAGQSLGTLQMSVSAQLVPEPSGTWLMALGLLCLTGLAWRRTSHTARAGGHIPHSPQSSREKS